MDEIYKQEGLRILVRGTTTMIRKKLEGEQFMPAES